MQFVKVGVLTVLFALIAFAPSQSASAAERSLGGIKLFGPALSIVRKYGTPNEVRKGDISTAPPAGAQAGQAGLSFPSTAGQPPAQSPTDPNNPAGTSSATGAPTVYVPGLVTWVYYLPNGNMMEFVITEADGRVVRIHLTGYRSAIKTARGITLGQTYKQVVDKYGFPEDHDAGTPTTLSSAASSALPGQSAASTPSGTSGTTATVSTQDVTIVEAIYAERQHVTFQFYKQRVVGILVGIVD